MAEFDDKLNSLLSNPEAMDQIMKMAQSLMGNGGGTEQPPPAAPPSGETGSAAQNGGPAQAGRASRLRPPEGAKAAAGNLPRPTPVEGKNRDSGYWRISVRLGLLRPSRSGRRCSSAAIAISTSSCTSSAVIAPTVTMSQGRMVL